MKTIDIITSNNVTIQYELGTLAQRFLALLIDAAIVGVYYFIALILVTMIINGVDNYAPSDATWVEHSLFLKPSAGNESYWLYFFFAMMGVFFASILLIPVFFYRFLCEYFFGGRTVGKMAVGLRVLRMDGTVPSASEYFLRNIFMAVDFWGSIGSFGFLFASSSEHNQRLGDMVSNTTVIRLNPSVSYSIKDILTIKTSENYEPQYHTVTRFTDEDMLLIKNAIDRVRQFPNQPHKKLVLELAAQCQTMLGIDDVPKNKLAFLKTLLQDYIVLTRS